MVLEVLESGAICRSCVSVVLQRLKTDVLVVGVTLSVDGESAGAGTVMVLERLSFYDNWCCNVVMVLK